MPEFTSWQLGERQKRWFGEVDLKIGGAKSDNSEMNYAGLKLEDLRESLDGALIMLQGKWKEIKAWKILGSREHISKGFG